MLYGICLCLEQISVGIVEDADIGVARFLYMHVIDRIGGGIEGARSDEPLPVACGGEIDVVSITTLGTPINEEFARSFVINPFGRLGFAEISSGRPDANVPVLSNLPVDEVFAL